METPMDHATNPAPTTVPTRAADEPHDASADGTARPADEAYEDSWYRVLRGWESPAPEPEATDDTD